MTGILVVASRELKERKSVFVAALVAGVLPLLAPMMPGFARQNPGELREITALVLAANLAIVIGLIHGGSAVSGELKERRMGFFFSRPLPSLAIWGGKLLAGFLLVIGAGVVTLLPTAVFAGGFRSVPAGMREVGSSWVAAAVVGAALLVLGVAAACGIAVRSRAGWLLTLDLGLLGLVGAAVWKSTTSLELQYASDAFVWGLVGFGCSTTFALLAAGYAQVAAGRTDIRRGHRAQSLTLWSLLAVSATALAFYSGWVLSATPQDYAGVEHVSPAPAGSWMVISGRARGRGDFRPAFLLNANTRETIRVGVGLPWGGVPVTFAADGSRAAWLSRSGGRVAQAGGVAGDIAWADLGSRAAAPVATRISLRSQWTAFELSGNGGRLAVMEGGIITVYELAGERMVVSARLPDGIRRAWFRFVDADLVRIFGYRDEALKSQNATVVIAELDVPGRKLTLLDSIPDQRPWLFVTSSDRALGRFISRGGGLGSTQLLLREGRTGAVLAKLTDCTEPDFCSAALLLSDGRIALGEAGPRGARLRVLSPAGAPERIVELGAGSFIRLIGEAAPGRVIVGLHRAPRSERHWRDEISMLVGVTDGAVRPLGDKMVPLGSWRWYSADPPAAPGSLATRLFLDADGRVVQLDPASGKLTEVVSSRWNTAP
jgi:hypothetical protein